MFTGIIEEVGTVLSLSVSGSSAMISVKASGVLEGTDVGDSIAVNGVCLTVTSVEKEMFTADVMPETLRRSNLGECRNGSRINLERAMPATGRFGGHIVSGHIDGTGTVSSKRAEGNAVWIKVDCNEQLMQTIVQKGSVALDGISLTVARTWGTGFAVSIIPHTAGQTTLTDCRVGDTVNIETDIIGKYVQRLMEKGAEQSHLTMQFLEEMGF